MKNFDETAWSLIDNFEAESITIAKEFEKNTREDNVVYLSDEEEEKETSEEADEIFCKGQKFFPINNPSHHFEVIYVISETSLRWRSVQSILVNIKYVLKTNMQGSFGQNSVAGGTAHS